VPTLPAPSPQIPYSHKVGQGEAQHCKDFGIYSYPFSSHILSTRDADNNDMSIEHYPFISRIRCTRLLAVRKLLDTCV
jgi:hypothetical protein